MSDCCATPSPTASLRLTPWDCFQRGLRTLRLPPLPVQGEALAGDGGRRACFSLRVQDGRLQQLRFACTRCTTLVACCQALVELNRGCLLRAPQACHAQQLLARLPGVPVDRQACAALAAAALRSALLQADPSTHLRE